MIDIVFSIPIHERFEVVVDQIINFRHFNPNCGFVFHLSQGFDYKNSKLSKSEFLDICSEIGGIYINPHSLRTGLYDIIQAHISNYRFVSQQTEFRAFCMAASNEMFIKPGLAKLINSYDCCVSFQDKNHERTKKTRLAREDSDLLDMTYCKNPDNIRYSQIEGTFYKNELFKKLVDIIEENYDYTNMKIAHAREEVYFSTVLYGLIKEGYSVSICDIPYTWMNWSNGLKVNISDIKTLLSECPDKYCVKRVDRVLDDHVRNYIILASGYKKTRLRYLQNHNLKPIWQIYFIDQISKLKHYIKHNVLSPIYDFFTKNKNK